MTNQQIKNQEAKEKWVKALRSGNYKRGKGRLRSNMGYCCLGVLCDISGLGEWESPILGYEFDSTRNYLPMSVMEWAGITVENEGVSGSDIPLPTEAKTRIRREMGVSVKTLAELNDALPHESFAAGFDYIATIVEEYY